MNIHIIYQHGARFQTWNWDKICILRMFAHDGLVCQLVNWLCPLWLSNSSWRNQAKVAIPGFTHPSKWINHLFTTINRTCQHKKSQKSRSFRVMWRPCLAVCRATLIYVLLSLSPSLSFLFSTSVTRRRGPVGGTRSSRKWKPGWIDQLPEDTTITMTSHNHAHREQIVEVLYRVSVKCFNQNHAPWVTVITSTKSHSIEGDVSSSLC